MNQFARFENLVERLVEGTFTRLFADRLPPQKIVNHLMRAMEDNQTRLPDGLAQAPNRYWIYLHPSDREALVKNLSDGPEDASLSLDDELARYITDLATQADLVLEDEPVVQVLADENMAPRDVRVEARCEKEEQPETEQTREINSSDANTEEEIVAQAPPGRPFLVMEGHRHVNLHRAVVSVGRAIDNDIIIEDPRVSRHHAQFRQRYGHYVLYDLGSSGGTQINGYPIEECVLHSGDVVSFAGVQVIYGEDPPTPYPLPGSGDTPALDTPESELD